ncbi:hypothetical protein BDW22DRAFT_1345868 [Trametopsis cervina]|nr:hypothetical protein BDW22DRAFT_1345868 [Trametopsis cervina]
MADDRHIMTLTVSRGVGAASIRMHDPSIALQCCDVAAYYAMPDCASTATAMAKRTVCCPHISGNYQDNKDSGQLIGEDKSRADIISMMRGEDVCCAKSTQRITFSEGWIGSPANGRQLLRAGLYRLASCVCLRWGSCQFACGGALSAAPARGRIPLLPHDRSTPDLQEEDGLGVVSQRRLYVSRSPSEGSRHLLGRAPPQQHVFECQLGTKGCISPVESCNAGPPWGKNTTYPNLAAEAIRVGEVSYSDLGFCVSRVQQCASRVVAEPSPPLARAAGSVQRVQIEARMLGDTGERRQEIAALLSRVDLASMSFGIYSAFSFYLFSPCLPFPIFSEHALLQVAWTTKSSELVKRQETAGRK